MISSIQNSLTGVRAASDSQSVSAHNVANTNTDGFKSYVASSEEQGNGGVKVILSRTETPGTLYDRGDGVDVESSNVDLAREVANQINAQHQMDANIAAIKSADKMVGSIIDILV